VHRFSRFLFGFLFLTFLGSAVCGQVFHTKVKLISESKVITLGQTFDVGLLLNMDKDWHTYSKNPGDSGLPTSVNWTLPNGFIADEIQWPAAKPITAGGLTSYGYEDQVLLLIKIHVPSEGYHNGQAVIIKGKVNWLECHNICVPGTAEVSLPLRIGQKPELSSTGDLALFQKYRELIPPEASITQPSSSINPLDPLANLPSFSTNSPAQHPRIRMLSQPPSQSLELFWKSLLGAFVGGMILNLMPCVLPVIAIKILGFVKQSNESPKKARHLGIFFALGVIVSFWALAFLVIALQAAGHQVGWGSIQFQEPRFLMAMALIVTLISLNFFGLFEIEAPSKIIQGAGNLSSRSGMTGAFLNGILATLLATPCTAPFLAQAVGFAFTQSPLFVFTTFSAAGIGLAFPYMILAWRPGLLRWLPKPGNWMIRFKQTMGFVMLATAIWLLFNLSSHSTAATFFFAGWLLFISFAVWFLSAFFERRMVPILIILTNISIAAFWHVSPMFAEMESTSMNQIQTDKIDWKPFSKSALQSALETHQPVFIDFTADWCLTCQVNKKVAIETEAVAQKIKDLHIIPFLADWTRRNDEITETLISFQRSGVPFYIIYPANRSKQPILLPEVLTPKIVLDALTEASAP
jgi:thiol:disulfide interchange protein